jgi:hypothetical protein
MEHSPYYEADSRLAEPKGPLQPLDLIPMLLNLTHIPLFI